MPTIITYNVNGIRAAVKKDLAQWLSASNADVLCLQEIKASPSNLMKPSLMSWVILVLSILLKNLDIAGLLSCQR